MINKNIYEEQVDSLMIDIIRDTIKLPEDKKSALIERLKTLPRDKKRLGILGLLDDNRNLLLSIKDLINTPPESKTEHISKLIEHLRTYVKVGDVERKKFGEVMTPIELVDEMLDTLPYEVWSDHTLKWLDPANGCGVFPAAIVQRLMVGLEDIFPCEEERYTYIVEEMIYVCELQPKNMFLNLCAFDPQDKYLLNIYTGSFLEEGFDDHMKNVWGVDKFDIIVGNPPYQAFQEAKGKRGGGDTLWDKFVIKSLENVLKEKGLLCFVHPTIWRKPQSERSSSKKVNELMMKKQIHYLECHNSDDGMKVFNAGTRYDFYLLENSPIYTETVINGEDRINITVDLSNYSFIPNYNLEVFDKIVTKKEDIKCPIIFNVSNYETRKNWVSDVQSDKFKYSLIHTTPKAGTRYRYSSRNDKGHFGIPKVIFGDSGIYDVIIDMNGEYGMTQHSMAIKVDNLQEAENIKIALLSENFTEFLKTVMWSNFQIDWRLFSYLKKDFWKEFITKKVIN